MQFIEIAEEERPIFHVLPRGMAFSSTAATSIDLFVCEVAALSRFPVEIVAEVFEPALAAKKIHPLPRYNFARTLRRARKIAALVDAANPRLVIVQQHLPSASAIRVRTRAPMLLQRHNFMRPPRQGFFGAPSRMFHARQLAALDGLTFVSQAACEDFERDWPEVETPRWVVPNGVDCADWRPRAERDSLALVVGRATPEKGLLEAAEALAATLPAHPGWSTAFVVAGAERGADYLRRLRQTLAPLAGRACVLTDIAFAEVKALNERAAIALVPSKWREPFGRTCLEALAGGAALITSGSGGLKEISGEAALYVPDAAPAGLAEALRTLIVDADLRRRLSREGPCAGRSLFDLPRVAAKLDDVCEAVMARAESAAPKSR